MSDYYLSLSIVITLIVMIILITYIYKDRDIDRIVLTEYFSIIGGLSIISFLFTYIVTSYENYQQNRHSTIIKLQDDRLDAIGYIDKLFIQEYPYLNRLYDELYPRNKVYIPSDNEIDTKKRNTLETFAINYIITYIEATYITNLANNYIQQYMNRQFKMFFKSPMVREYWINNQNLFSSVFNNFVQHVLLT